MHFADVNLLYIRMCKSHVDICMHRAIGTAAVKNVVIQQVSTNHLLTLRISLYMGPFRNIRNDAIQ